MNVMEYSAKEIFQQYGIPTPDGYTVTSQAEIQEVMFPVVVKAQVQTGGRGKAGGIKFAATTEEARHAAGVILGMATAAVAVRSLESYVYEVPVTDPMTFAGVALAVIVVAVLATWIPARRAARIDPVEALRSE